MNFISNHFVSISLLLCIVVLLFHIRDLRHKLRRLYAIVRRLHLQERTLLSELENKPQAKLSKEESLFVRICQLMDEDKPYASPDFKPEDLAASLGTNRTYLANAIKRYGGGLTISQFITRYRLRYASQLLERTDLDLSVNDVSQMAGFSSRSTFNRQFALFFNDTPSDYKDMLSRQRAGETPSK